MKYSDEQQKIIDADIKNNLVSASAGSGKTTVLTERIGEEVKNGPLSVDRMLVVTFTEDAASHMADKIEEKLRNKRNEAAASGDNELASRLSSQIDLLPNAYIQTMHGFCSRVIREKGYLIKNEKMAEFTDPSCRIVSGSEQDVLLNTAIEYAIKDMYAECRSEDDPFIRFTRRFGDGRSDNSLAGLVKSTFKTLRSLPDYLLKCDALLKKREECDKNNQIMFSSELEQISGEIKDYLIQVKELFEDSSFASVLKEHPKYQIVEEYSNDEFLSLVTSSIEKAVEQFETHKGIDFFECLAPVKDLNSLTFKSFFQKADLNGDDRPILAVVTLRHFISPGCLSDSKYTNPYDLPDEYIKLIGFDKEQILANQKTGTEACRSFVELLKMRNMRILRTICIVWIIPIWNILHMRS